MGKKTSRIEFLGKEFGRVFASSYGPSGNAINGLTRVLIKSGNELLTTLPEEWWIGYISAVKAPRADLNTKETALAKVTREIPADSLPGLCWLELYRICLISGLFRVGLLVRYKAEHSIVEESHTSRNPGKAEAALAISLEVGAWTQARELLARAMEAGLESGRAGHARWLIDSLEHGIRHAFPPKAHMDPTEQAFLVEAKNKRIAVVGPVPSKAESGSEIDSFDLVAKFNYRGAKLGCDPVTQGRRVDIAYYNIEQSKYIARKMSPSFLRELRYPVFIKPKGYRVLKEHASHGRLLSNVEWLLPDTEFNAGPNAVYDLLRFCPGEVKIFNSDLMLTAGRFAGYWQPGAKEVNYCYSFAKTHDPVLQFRHFQHALAAELISGDAAFREVMAMTLEQYIERLQSAHGGIAREALYPPAAQ
tara:strand:+ start:2802 stop:4058 length:1257 start_codon:yes stop_codon:yes gene_type:complete